MQINEDLLNDIYTYEFLTVETPLSFDLKEVVTMDADISELPGTLKLIKFE